MSGCVTNFTKKRYIAYITSMIIFILLPFVKINGNHFFLLSFDHKKLNLFFIAFDTQELYLMPFLIIGMFLTILFITTLAGRIWCAWTCPQTIARVIYRDLLQTKIFKIYKSIENKQKPSQGFFVRKFLSIVIFYILSLIMMSAFLWYFVPPEDFFTYIQNPKDHLLLLGILFCASLAFTFDIVYLGEKFCVYICPYARIQSVMFDNNTIQVIYDEKRGGVIYDGHTKLHKKPPQGECIGCEACVKICPTHIDIRQGMQLECINCLECADACSKVQAKFDRPSLINWTSAKAIQDNTKVKYLRFRTIGYLVVLCIVFTALVIMGSKKEHMLLNINRSSQLYNIHKTSKNEIEITNAYIFLFQNTDNRPHEYYFDVNLKDIQDGLEIIRPKKPFKLDAGQKSKQIVVLKAKKKLADNDRKDTVIPLIIKAYALDDEKIVVTRESNFVYPKNSLLNHSE